MTWIAIIIDALWLVGIIINVCSARTLLWNEPIIRLTMEMQPVWLLLVAVACVFWPAALIANLLSALIAHHRRPH